MTLKLDGSSGSVSIDAPTNTAGGADRTLTLPDDSGNGTILTTSYPSSLQVLEQFYLIADGTSVTTSNGTVTSTNVTGNQTLTTTHTEITGSSITYTPPTGATLVIYEFDALACNDDDSRFLVHYKLQIDGTDVDETRDLVYQDDYEYQQHLYFKYPIHIGGTADAATGRQASWTSNKTLRVTGREWGSNYDVLMHKMAYWDGANPAITRRPRIGITAIG